MFNRIQLYGELFREDPLNFVIYMATMIVAVLVSLILHECAHGYMALRCGDPTAKMMGRLSLNPLRHLDPVGTLCMFLLGFGWAKPVPVNPRNFRDLRRDDFLVSIAGIAVNMTLFILCCALVIPVSRLLWKPNMYTMAQEMYGSTECLVNIFSKDESAAIAHSIAYGFTFDWLQPFLQHGWLAYVQRFLFMMAEINLGLAIFNLLPIPPLDGYHLLNDTLLKGRLDGIDQFHQITRLLLIVLIVSDVLTTVLTTCSDFLGNAVMRTLLMMTGQM